MIVFSTIQYHRYGLTNDFAGYAQAWYLIGQGHLDPYVTVFRVDFLHNNLDLAMYPLAFLGRVVATPVMLSWAQDVAVVATEAVTLLWIRDLLQSRGASLERLSGRITVTAALILAFNPWSWETIAFSLHFEAFATLFAVAAARDIWRGRHLMLLLWVPLAIGSESLGSLYLLAIGVAAVVSRNLPRRTRLVGLTVLVSGLAGLVAISQLRLVGRSGATFGKAYSYLLPDHSGSVGLPELLSGLVSHLPSAATTVGMHVPYVLGYLIAGGTLGIFTPWGAAAAALIILPNALSGELPFIAFPGAFQSWPAQPFLVFGTVTVLTAWLAHRGDSAPLITPGFRRVTAIVIAGAATLAALQLTTMPRRWMPTAAEAAQLRTIDARIPVGAEVIANQNDIGRFAMNRIAYDYVNWGDLVPMLRRVSVIIVHKIPDRRDKGRLEQLTQHLKGARIIFDGPQYRAYILDAKLGALRLD
jgi:hypothetical protein